MKTLLWVVASTGLVGHGLFGLAALVELVAVVKLLG